MNAVLKPMQPPKRFSRGLPISLFDTATRVLPNRGCEDTFEEGAAKIKT